MCAFVVGSCLFVSEPVFMCVSFFFQSPDCSLISMQPFA